MMQKFCDLARRANTRALFQRAISTVEHLDTTAANPSHLRHKEYLADFHPADVALFSESTYATKENGLQTYMKEVLARPLPELDATSTTKLQPPEAAKGV